MDQKSADEQKLRAFVKGDAALASRAGGAWDDIAKAQARWRDIYIPVRAGSKAAPAFNSDLFAYARQIVRAAEERAKPNAERLREYTDARLAALRQAIAADTPIYPEFEQVRLSFSLERHARMARAGSPDREGGARIQLAGRARQSARRRLEARRRQDAGGALRRRTESRGGQHRSDDSGRPARSTPRRAALRKIFETEVDGPVQRAQQVISEARFKAFGTNLYPDATFTLRVTYGAVEGWIERGTPVDPFTRLARMYERTTGQAPFALPKRWLDAKSKLDLDARANFTATTDIVGGNSGSPMVNAAGEIVGLVFDGNIHSISGSYWFDTEKNRTVAVHPDFIRTALSQIYPAKALAAELAMRLRSCTPRRPCRLRGAARSARRVRWRSRAPGSWPSESLPPSARVSNWRVARDVLSGRARADGCHRPTEIRAQNAHSLRRDSVLTHVGPLHVASITTAPAGRGAPRRLRARPTRRVRRVGCRSAAECEGRDSGSLKPGRRERGDSRAAAP